MVNKVRRAFCATAASLPLLGARNVLAQSYPNKPIRIIVPYPGGDGTDVITRLLALRMQADLKVPVIIENRVGAAGLLGATTAASAPADGYTMCLMTSGHITHQTLYHRFDLLRQATPIANVATAPFLILVPPDSPYRTFQDLLKAIKERPNQVTLATGGIGSPAHMAWELLSTYIGDPKATHIPYKSGLESTLAVLAKQVDFSSSYIGSAYPSVKAGKCRALATTSANRLPSLPDVPTIAELLVPGFDFNTLLFYAAPPNTPAPIVDKLFASIRKASEGPEFQTTLDTLAHRRQVSKSPAELEEQLKVALASETKLIQTRGIIASS